MTERITGSYDNAQYKSTYTLHYFKMILSCINPQRPNQPGLPDRCGRLSYLSKSWRTYRSTMMPLCYVYMGFTSHVASLSKFGLIWCVTTYNLFRIACFVTLLLFWT